MTRDEAIRAFNNVTNSAFFASEVWIERFVALGMLKLDEPRPAVDTAVDAMFGWGNCSRSGVITPRHAIDAIHAAGLKIVEAK